MKGFFYRLLMRLAHRFDWHYAPEFGPFEDGSTQKWCQWCGFRQSYPPKGSRTAQGAISLMQEQMKRGEFRTKITWDDEWRHL